MTTPIDYGVLWLAVMLVLFTTIGMYSGVFVLAVCLGLIVIALLVMLAYRYVMSHRHMRLVFERNERLRRATRRAAREEGIELGEEFRRLCKTLVRTRNPQVLLQLVAFLVMMGFAFFLWIPVGLILSICVVSGLIVGLIIAHYENGADSVDGNEHDDSE